MSGPGATARARVALARALRGALARGEGVPCLHPTRGAAWTSDDPDELAEAAEACTGCPVLDVCRDAGRFECWGVWGGIVRGIHRARRLPVQHTALLALATSPRPLTVDAVAAEVAPLLPEAVSRKRVADALSKATRLGLALRVAPSTFTSTAKGEAVAADWLDAAEGVSGSASPAVGARPLHPTEGRTPSTQNERSHIEGIDR